MKRKTDRQTVIEAYPNADLDFHICVVNNWLTSYTVRTCPRFHPNSEIIAKGQSASAAWRNAKNKIKNKKQ